MLLDEYRNIICDLIQKIENIENLLNVKNPRHIPAYQKILGLQQKFQTLSMEEKEYFFSEIIKIRGIITYFLNGRYEDGVIVLKNIKDKLSQTIIKDNENYKNTEI